MKEDAINIYIDHSEYNKVFYTKSKQIVVNSNLDDIVFYESLIDTFINNDEYFDALKEALSKRENLNLVVMQDNVVLQKNVYSPVSIVLAIKTKEDLPEEFKREFMVLINKIKIESYLAKKSKKTYTISVDNKSVELTYNDILEVILNSDKCYEFMNSKSKYLDLTKLEFVYILREFIIDKRIFLAFDLTKQQITYYKSLIQMYDISAINKYLETNFKYTNDVKINSDFENTILAEIPKNISLLEKTMYIYINMFQLLKYDLELVDDNIIKKHKDLSRIQEIDVKNNRVFSYEFSCLLGKILEKLDIKFEYNDKYIIARINKFIIKYKAITQEFNLDNMSQLDILKGISVLNDNKDTKNEFYKIVNKIYNNVYQKKINVEILNMPFNKLINQYKLNTNKITIPFERKLDIFKALISNVALENNAIGYIYEIKRIIFNEDELNANISFATIAENENGEINPAVIITVNNINVNLYNSNKYIYYNPPRQIENYSLNELRLQFFNGRFKYIKNNKDNIIGVEKSSIC